MLPGHMQSKTHTRGPAGTAILAMILGPLLSTIAAAQADRAALRKIAKRLENPALVGDARAELVDVLLDMGGNGAVVLAKATSVAARDLAKDIDKAQKALLRKVGSAASRAIRSKSRGQEEEIARHQKAVAEAGRDPNLTKAKVQSVSDPAMSALEKLLTVDLREVEATDDALAAELEAQRDRIDALSGLQLDWDYAVETLTADDGTSPDLAKIDPPPAGDVIAARYDSAIAFELMLATPMSDRDQKVFRRNAGRRSEIGASAADGIRRLNVIRVLIGKNALDTDAKLCEASADHSADMERLDFFAHESPVEGKRTPAARAARFGTSANAENIARGHTTGPSAIRGWWYSPGHHRNMLASHGRVGLGRSGTFWTQMFGG